MSGWNDGNKKVKDLFDTIRNYALTGVVFYLGVYALFRKSGAVFGEYPNLIMGVALVVASVYLFVLNTVNFNRTVREEHAKKNVGSIFYYAVPMLMSLLSLALFTNTALQIDVGDGRRLGDVSVGEIVGKKEGPGSEKQ